MLRFFIVVIFILNSIQLAYACGPFYINIFHQPHYIDPEFRQDFNSVDEESYNKNTQFRFILQSLARKPQIPPYKNDSEARKLSQKKQPGQYTEYRKGVEKFNQASYEEALNIFSGLKQSGSGWAREASTYMIARTQKNLAEKNWDGMWYAIENNESSPAEMINQTVLQQAKRSYEIYLEEYPHGLYANSARNIKRHFLLLSGSQDEYNQAIIQAIAEQGPHASQDLLDEYSNHYKGNFAIAKDTPPLLIAYNLIHHDGANQADLATLKSREQDFINYPGLFSFLRALTLYKLNEYQTLLSQTPKMPLSNTPLSISLEFLRYRAEFNLNKNEEALASLIKIHTIMPDDSSIERHLALMKIKENQALWLFSNKDFIHDKEKLALFAQYGLTDTDLLRGLTMQDISKTNHRILAEELAQRYLLNRDYAKLISLLEQYPEITAYNSIRPDILALIKDINNAFALLQIGTFIYHHYVFAGAPDMQDPYYGPDARLNELFTTEETLKKIFLERTRNYVPPVWYYKKALQLIQAFSISSSIEARALSYLAKCPRYLEDRQRCTWGEKIDYNPKFYFDLLHNKYKDSEWAKKTPYWYMA